ncbi:hypothetical protein C8A03DRAFT_39354 [Achaetomium macrosporum]|uniref:Uncharacterized protein n=1 Tax=Achaetomium macrosporum TaxID=79813 RepID=A0AAN7C1T6_9PEZI|nr:hypothetical protein C8A03DRAFT_39354 [Achaetomium macrosporum]
MTAITKLALATTLLAALAVALPASPDDGNTTSAAGPSARAAQACSCFHNNDAGRWDDRLDPAGRIADLCSVGGGCYQAAIGRIQCACATQAGKDWQSWHGNWFLWTAVTCGGLSVTITG